MDKVHGSLPANAENLDRNLENECFNTQTVCFVIRLRRKPRS